MEDIMIAWFGGTWGAAGHAWWLVLALSLLGLIGFIAWWRVRTVWALDATGTLLRHFSLWRMVAKVVLLGIGVLSLFLALLHPKWGMLCETVQQQGRDVFLALDISRSMLARDVPPDRLTVAKQAIKQLLDALQADRVSLMLFGEKAWVHCPLTHDRELVELFLNHIDQSVVAAGTTRLDEPIILALAQCQRTPERKSRLLVILTDGEDFSGALETIANRAAQERLIILVIGVGTRRGAPIPRYDAQGVHQGFVKDAAQQVVVSQLNETALRALAQKTGGQAVFVNGDTVDVRSIVAAITRCEKEKQGQQQLTSLCEQYHWFLLLAFICLLVEWVL